MYYILEWMLVGSIPHVDGASIWLPYFGIDVYIIMFVRLLRLSIFKRLKSYLLLLCNAKAVSSLPYMTKRCIVLCLALCAAYLFVKGLIV